MNEKYKDATTLSFLNCTDGREYQHRVNPKKISVRQYSFCLKKLINEVG